jgi:hypothetical protein
MIREAKVLHDMVKELQTELLPLLTLLENKTLVDKEKYGINQADTAYACRETNNILKDLTTRINKVAQAAKLISNHFMMNRKLSKIRTEYCTASAKPRIWFKIAVKRDHSPEEHDLLQRFCGLPQEMAEKEVLRIHPPNFMDYLTERIGRGDSIPIPVEGIQKTEFDLLIRGRKAI